MGDFAAAHLLPDEGSRGWLGGPSRFLLPPSFLPLAAALHQLAWGPLLSHGALSSPDARELGQAHFLTASLAASRAALLPTLELALPPGLASPHDPPLLPPAPAADVLLLPRCAALVDAGSELLVWSDAAASPAQVQACMARSRMLAAGRTPAPDVTLAPAGSAAEAGRLLPRLMLLGDARKWLQHAAVPLLERLPPDEAAVAARAAAARLYDSAAPSLQAWLAEWGVRVMAHWAH